MSCDVFKGRDHTLVGQFNATTVYGTAPTAAATALQIKFNSFSLDRAPVRVADPTINPALIMREKTDEIDEAPSGSIATIACLREAHFWMRSLFGSPVSTGTAPNLVRTYTLTALCKPDFLLELVGRIPLLTDQFRIDRFVGALTTSWEWDVLGEDQNFNFGLLMARRVTPTPTTRFQATPTLITKARARSTAALIYDVAGASTLGKVTGCTLSVNQNYSPQRVADGLAGYGDVLTGTPEIGGTITTLYQNGGIANYSRDHTTRRLVIESTAATGEKIVCTFPNVEFTDSAISADTPEGLARTYNWRAFDIPGGDPTTVAITSSLATLPG